MKKVYAKNSRPGRLYLHLLPALIWLAAVAGVVGLFYHRSQSFEVIGIAQEQIRQIAAPCDGRIKNVYVQLFEKVQQGQTIAVLDDEQIKAQIATISAEIKHLMAQIVPTQETLLSEAAVRETDKMTAQRRFSVDVENARLRILELKTILATDRMTLQNLALETKIAEELTNQGAIAPYELQKAQSARDIVAKTIEENENLMEQAEQALKEAQQRYDEFAQHQLPHPLVDSALAVIHEAIKVQEYLIDELLAQCKVLELKSPIDGVVIQIQGRANELAVHRPGEGDIRRPGEVVMAGEPIVTIAEAKPRDIIAYLREDQLDWPAEGMSVELVKNNPPAQIARSQVSYLGPVVEVMPQRLWRSPNIAQWGRPILIKIPPGLKLLPGEAVGIRGL